MATPTLTETLRMLTQQYAYVVTAFQAGQALSQPIAGFVLGAVGVTIGFAIFAFGWAVANRLNGLASSWPALAFFRSLLGMSEAAIVPAGMKAISQWSPARERSVAAGWLDTGTSIGAMSSRCSWPSAFSSTTGNCYSC